MTNPGSENPEWFAPYEAAMQKLLKIPGVKSVGLGMKEKAGAVVPLWVLRVYVEYKKPLAELKPEEVIPAQVDGIPTDVLVESSPRDDNSFGTPFVQAGGGIQRQEHSKQGAGTAGPVVWKSGDLHVVTNRHVLEDDKPHGGNYDTYCPEYSSCRSVAAETVPNAGHKGAFVFNSKTYDVDCAMAKFKTGTLSSNTIPGIGELRRAIRDLSSEAVAADGHTPANQIIVMKRGDNTGLTSGVVVELCFTSGGNTIWRLKYMAQPYGGYDYDVTFRIDTSEPKSIANILADFNGTPVTATLVTPGGRDIRFQGKLFAFHGDSGAPVCDLDRKLVALHYSSDYRTYKVNFGGTVADQDVSRGYHFGTHAAACWNKLGLDPASAISSSSGSSSAAVLEIPEEAIAAQMAKPLKLEIKESDIYQTRAGRIMLDAWFTHSRELTELVHHNREVKVAYHRVKGPGWMVVMLQGLRDKATPIPAEVEGISIRVAMRRLFEALQAHASPALLRDLLQFGPVIQSLFADAPSFESILQKLQQEEVTAL